MKSFPNQYYESIPKYFGKKCNPDTILSYPFTFGGFFNINEHPLYEENALSSVGFLMSILALENQSIRYCPILPNIIGIILTCCTLTETFWIVQSLITKSLKDNVLLPFHPVDYVLIVDELLEGLELLFPD